jgi:phosphoglycolate phosphatase-like HAD superfamily hydrolase
MCVFNVDGTLINEQRLITKSLTNALKYNNIECDQNDVNNIGDKFNYLTLRKIIKNTHYKSFETTYIPYYKYRQMGEQPISKIDNIYIDYATANVYGKFIKNLKTSINENIDYNVIPGTMTLIKNLHSNDIKICLNTNYPYSVMNCFMDKLDIRHMIDGCMSDNINKPFDNNVKYFMKTHNINDPQQVMCISDKISDIKEGNEINVKYSIGVLTGDSNFFDLKNNNSDYIFDSVNNLNHYLKYRKY